MADCGKALKSGLGVGLRLLLMSLPILLLAAGGCGKPGYQFGKDVLAVVEGETVTLEEYRAACETDPPKSPEAKKQVLGSIIKNRLLAKLASSKGMLGDPQVYSNLENFYTERLPVLLREKIDEDAAVADEELPGFKEKSSLKPVLLVSGIVTHTIKEAEAAQAEIKQGAAFEDVAKKYSTTRMADRGVDLGDEMFPVGVRAVLNGMKPGSVSPVMKVDIGYAIFKLKGRKEPGDVWEEKAEALRAEVKKQKVETQLAQILDRWRKSADIKLISGPSQNGVVQYTGAVVNGVTISIDPSMFTGQKDPHSPHSNMNVETLTEALNKKVNGYLLSQEARLRGLQNDPDFQIYLKLKKEEILADAYMMKVKGEYEVTPQDIQDYYNKNKEKLALKPSVRVSRILLNSREEAESALGKLKAGKGFSSVAKESSKDAATSDKGGDAGFVVPERLDEPVKSTLARMKVGEISGVLKTGYGYEILKLTDKKEGGEPEMSAVIGLIRKRVLLVKKAERLEEFFNSLNKEADIKINEALLKSL